MMEKVTVKEDGPEVYDIACREVLGISERLSRYHFYDGRERSVAGYLWLWMGKCSGKVEQQLSEERILAEDRNDKK